jgi:hypothetical protein
MTGKDVDIDNDRAKCFGSELSACILHIYINPLKPKFTYIILNKTGNVRIT